MTDIARFLRDVLLYPRLRELARADIDEAMRAYSMTEDERSLVRSADPRLLSAIGSVVRASIGPSEPEVVLPESPAVETLSEAALWMRLVPYRSVDGTVAYSAGLAGKNSVEPPYTPVLAGRALPVIDLEIEVTPTIRNGRLSFSGSMLPRAYRPAAPVRSREHSRFTQAVRDAVHAALLNSRRVDGVLGVIQALLHPPSDAMEVESPPLRSNGPHLTILGTGMVVPDHMTNEAERVIRQAREVFFVDTGVATAAWLKERCPRVTCLLDGYVEGGSRLQTYEYFVAQVVAACLERPPVVFAMSGHPLVGAYAPFLMADVARAFGLEVAIQPGISALSCILAELEIDPILTGVQMVEATDLLLQKRPLQPDMPTLVWQVGTVGTLLHSERVRPPAAYAPLRDHLQRFYGESHEVIAIYVSPHPMVPGLRRSVRLGELCSLAAELHAGVSLWIPARHARPNADPLLADQLLRTPTPDR